MRVIDIQVKSPDILEIIKTNLKIIITSGALENTDIGLAITVMLFILRIPVVKLAISKKDQIPHNERRYMSAIDPKGLTAAVLATQAIAYIPDMEVGFFIRNIVFSVILFSIIINSILIPLIGTPKTKVHFESNNYDVAD